MRIADCGLRIEGSDRHGRRARFARRAIRNPKSEIRNRSALTLIELLVVIIILTTLVSAAIPIMAPTNDDRRLREASRSVNAFISAAQMKAVQTQRPVGVALKRLSQDTESADDNAACVELYYVEQPAPYRGFDRTSSAMVARHPDLNRAGQVLIQFVVRGNTNADSLPVGWDADLFPPFLIRPGDVIEIDGTRYRLLDPNFPSLSGEARIGVNSVDGTFTAPGSGVVRIEAQPVNDTGQMLNITYDDDGNRLRDRLVSTPDAPFWTNPASYKILRQPKFTSAEPFQMPEGTAIDLRASGQAIEIDAATDRATGFFYNLDAVSTGDRVDNSDPIIIMFTPEGAVERVQFNAANAVAGETAEIYDARTVSNLYLLIGRRENAPPPAATATDDKSLDNDFPTWTDEQKQEAKETVNWLRGESRWIVIGSQSGRVVTVENAFVEPGRFLPLMEPENIVRARQIDASREFAREMVQVGGR